MRLTAPTHSLLSACNLVATAVGKRTTKPILSSVKAIADPDGLTLIATDLDIGISHRIVGIKVEEPGQAIFPVSRLVSILRETTDDSILIDANDRRCLVETTASEYEMATESPDEFPDVLFDSDFSKHVSITAGNLSLMIRRTCFAAAKQDTKFAITGILWEVEEKENKLRIVATDTKRLAITTGDLSSQAGLSTSGRSHLTPPKAMHLLDKMLSESDAEQQIQVCFRSSEALFKTEKTTIYTRLVEGRYPPYRDIIPKKFSINLSLDCSSFLGSIKQAAVMVDDESKKVSFDFTPGKLILNAKGPCTGRSKVELPIEYQGESISINFDPNYVIEMLRIADQDKIELNMVSNSKPALFKIGDDYLYMVMPMA